MPAVKFTSHLLRYFPALREADYAGATTRGVLQTLEQHYPGLSDYLLEENGAIRKHVNIFVGQRRLRERDELDAPVPPNSVVSFFQALSGG